MPKSAKMVRNITLSILMAKPSQTNTPTPSIMSPPQKMSILQKTKMVPEVSSESRMTLLPPATILSRPVLSHRALIFVSPSGKTINILYTTSQPTPSLPLSTPSHTFMSSTLLPQKTVKLSTILAPTAKCSTKAPPTKPFFN